MMVEEWVGRVELRVVNGTQNIEPLVQRSVERVDVKNRRGIEIPEAMVFGLVGGGERLEVGRVGDDVGKAGKRPDSERHGVRMLQWLRENNVESKR